MPNYYPIMLDVRNRTALVIGGDQIAAEKATNLSLCGALVTAMAPDFCAELLDLERSGTISLRHKAYEPGDLKGAFVVVAATTHDLPLSKTIWQEAQERGQLLNIVDIPAYCNFILPSILRRGQLTIAVSTEGASPSLAKRIRQQLEDRFPPAYATYLQIAATARANIKKYGLSYAERDDFFRDFFTSDILELLSNNNEVEALTKTVQLLQQHHIDISVTTLLNDLNAADTFSTPNGRDHHA
jgi:precorrin-2 dehydrogenase/sirohydrochlorin ferrochelatase